MTVVINRNTLRYTLQNENNVDLSGKLLASVGKYTHVDITINAGTTIGGDNNDFALRTGDLSVFPGIITINNYGLIIGKAGVPLGGAGGDAVWLDHPVVFNNYGTVAGGGGAGGRGGSGATGSNVQSWSAGIWKDGGSNKYGWHLYTCDSNAPIWNDVDIGYACSKSYIRNSAVNGDYVYAEGGHNDDGFDAQWRKIKRGAFRTGTRGTGGYGGNGAGYNQSQINGFDGFSGTYSAGKGAPGGNGGELGKIGKDGSKGWNGTQFTDIGDASFGGRWQSRTTTTNGLTGTDGGAAGTAVLGQTGSTGSTYNEFGIVHGSVTLL